MILDDEALIAWGIADEMEEFGWEVDHVVGTAKDAIAIAEAGKIDAAVIDYNLRDSSSETVARALVARDIPFVFVSGAIPSQLPTLGTAVEVIGKPIDYSRINAVLSARLGPRSGRSFVSLNSLRTH